MKVIKALLLLKSKLLVIRRIRHISIHFVGLDLSALEGNTMSSDPAALLWVLSHHLASIFDVLGSLRQLVAFSINVDCGFPVLVALWEPVDAPPPVNHPAVPPHELWSVFHGMRNLNSLSILEEKVE